MHILPVKPNHGPHQNLCSPRGSSPVKVKHISIARLTRAASALFLVLMMLPAFGTGPAWAQQPAPSPNEPAQANTPQTIYEIRV
ncbi:MAG TPA: hypothetical protein VF730_06880, partial [Terracidiphilus sp.]